MSTSISTTPRERKLGFRVLFLGMFAIGTGQTLFIAVLPPYARGLGLSTTEIGLIFSLSALGWMFMSPFWGRKSDYVGRKSIILLGLFIYSITTILMGFEFKLHNDGFIGLTLLFILLMSFLLILDMPTPKLEGRGINYVIFLTSIQIRHKMYHIVSR